MVDDETGSILPDCRCSQNPLQTFKMESFAIIVNGFYQLTLAPKLSIWDSCGSPGKPSGSVHKVQNCHSTLCLNKNFFARKSFPSLSLAGDLSQDNIKSSYHIPEMHVPLSPAGTYMFQVGNKNNISSAEHV